MIHHSFRKWYEQIRDVCQLPRINSFEVIKLRKKKTWYMPFLAGISMLIMILDSQTAIRAVADALQLCIQVVVPSLFPLFVLSILLTSSLEGGNLSFLRPLGNFVHISRQSDRLLLTGFLSGYPSGAQCVAQVCKAGNLSKKDAEKMLSFCSNAGPSFIFGITSTLFTSRSAPWLLWMIQIASALLTGFLLNNSSPSVSLPSSSKPITLAQALQTSIRALTSVCGWILLFRCLLAYLEKWLYPFLPIAIQAILTGMLELTNGCWFLHRIPSEQLRFILCAMFLAFGSICVLKQTQAVTHGMNLSAYLIGKILQAVIAGLISVTISCFLFPENGFFITIPSLLFFCTYIILCSLKAAVKKKKAVDFPEIRVYNE